jgi:hypothetical protein
METNYYSKYLKYKNKYIQLKEQIGGTIVKIENCKGINNDYNKILSYNNNNNKKINICTICYKKNNFKLDDSCKKYYASNMISCTDEQIKCLDKKIKIKIEQEREQEREQKEEKERQEQQEQQKRKIQEEERNKKQLLINNLTDEKIIEYNNLINKINNNIQDYNNILNSNPYRSDSSIDLANNSIRRLNVNISKIVLDDIITKPNFSTLSKHMATPKSMTLLSLLKKY